jgi:hypothetical protein
MSNHRKSACTDNICMKAISVEQVYREAAAVLTRYAKPLDDVSRKTARSAPSLTVAKGIR